MSENTPEQVATKLAELEKAKQDLDAQLKAGAATAADTARRVEQLTGQLSLLSEAAKEVTQIKEEAPDLINDPEKALDYHFRKRTAPIIAANNVRSAAQEKELSKLRHGKDWEEFGPAVEAFVAKNGIPAETLATPGAYDGIMKLVKADKIDEIVKKQVAEQVAQFQENAAKAATSGATGAQKTNDAGKAAPEAEMSEDEARIAKKLGVSKEKWLETSKQTVYDGVRIRAAIH